MGVFEEGVEDQEEFSGDGDEGDFGGFTVGAEPLIEGAQVVVPAGGDDGCTVQGPAQGGPAVRNVRLATLGAGVVVGVYARRVGDKPRPTSLFGLEQQPLKS